MEISHGPTLLICVDVPYPLIEAPEETWDRLGPIVVGYAHANGLGKNWIHVGDIRHGPTWHAYFIRKEDC